MRNLHWTIRAIIMGVLWAAGITAFLGMLLITSGHTDIYWPPMLMLAAVVIPANLFFAYVDAYRMHPDDCTPKSGNRLFYLIDRWATSSFFGREEGISWPGPWRCIYPDGTRTRPLSYDQALTCKELWGGELEYIPESK